MASASQSPIRPQDPGTKRATEPEVVVVAAAAGVVVEPSRGEVLDLPTF